MGLFDAIKDALTTDDRERFEDAEKALTKAEAELAKVRADVAGKDDAASQERLARAEKNVTALQDRVEELAVAAGVTTPAAEAKAARAEADAAALDRIKEQQRQHAAEQAAEQAAQAEAPQATEEVAPVDGGPAEAEPLVAAEPVLREYTVVEGDTLSAIGKRFGVKWRDIAALNEIKNPDLIFPGQVFKIPNA